MDHIHIVLDYDKNIGSFPCPKLTLSQAMDDMNHLIYSALKYETQSAAVV